VYDSVRRAHYMYFVRRKAEGDADMAKRRQEKPEKLLFTPDSDHATKQRRSELFVPRVKTSISVFEIIGPGSQKKEDLQGRFFAGGAEGWESIPPIHSPSNHSYRPVPCTQLIPTRKRGLSRWMGMRNAVLVVCLVSQKLGKERE
jgi:hypothetical protein